MKCGYLEVNLPLSHLALHGQLMEIVLSENEMQGNALWC